MKKIGLVGGTGPESTIDYYRGLIGAYRSDTGLDEYPLITIESMNMSEMLRRLESGDRLGTAQYIAEFIENLRAAGAEMAAICANTPHIVWPEISGLSTLPLISIVEATVDYAKERGFRNVLILGTVNTMRSGLYARAFAEAGVGCTTPTPDDQQIVGGIIFPNLEAGIVLPEDKARMISLAERYIAGSGCDAVLLGCTEIPLMIKEGDLSVPVLDTTQIHIRAIYHAARS